MNRDLASPAIQRAAAALAWLTLASGCGGGGEPTKPAPDVGAATPVSCLGVDVTHLNPILVSPQGIPSGLCGLGGTQPCSDIAWALQLAGEINVQAVAVQHGLYETTRTIPLNNRVVVHGSCLFGDERDQKYRTVIHANPPPGTPAVSGNGITATVSGIVVIGKDASGASVAMALQDSNVTLNRTLLVAGKGADGPPAPPLSAIAPRALSDHCYRPGGAPSNALWGIVDPRTASWIPSIGGPGAGGGDTGPGGVGGRQGGPSIGLLLVNSTATASAPEYSRFVADSGGIGGPGQAGPSYGAGGGANSGGAGGNGGPSIGVALVGSSTWASDASFAYASAPGASGAGGAAGFDEDKCSGDPGAPGAPGGSAPAYTYVTQSTLATGQSLPPGLPLFSPDLQVQLLLQGDSNLCLSAAGRVLWCSQTAGQAIFQATMQTDGNFCMYPTQGTNAQPFCSGTASSPGAALAVQNDGHVQVIDAAGAVRWSVP